MPLYDNNIIQTKSKAFAVRIIRLCAHLRKEYKNDYIIETMAKQLLRSGTSIGANIRESKAAQSTADFISKLKIALKEGDECAYWLELMVETSYLSGEEFTSIYNDNKQINAILTKIINTTQSNNN
jgi:four helix bundle protein